MAPEMGGVNGLVAAPLTAMDLVLLPWAFFCTDLRNKDRLVHLPLMNVQVFLSIKLFPTILNITVKLSVRHHVLFNIEQSVCFVITTLKLTSLYLILDTLTSTEVASFMVNSEIFTTFWTLEVFVNPSVIVEGPGSSKSLATFVTVVLLVVEVGLLHVPDKFLLSVGQLRAQVTCEDLPLLQFNGVTITMHFMLHGWVKIINRSHIMLKLNHNQIILQIENQNPDMKLFLT